MLDLVLSSFPAVKAGVLPLIADHKPVTATLKLSVPSQVVTERKLWLFRPTQWTTDTILLRRGHVSH